MTRHSFLGVLVLAMLLAVAGLSTVSAGQKQYRTADGECCILVNGQCVPCPEGSTTASAQPAKAVSISSTAPKLASACGPGPCVPCKPGECAAGTPGSKQINSTLITSQAQPTPGCGSGPCAPCPAGQACATGASCSPGGFSSGAGYTLIGVRDANAGQIVVYQVPTATGRMLPASSTQKSADKCI